MQCSSIWPIDGTLSGATSPGQSGPGSDGNEGVFCILQHSSITGTSPSHCLVSYPDTCWESLTLLRRSSRCILQLQPTGQSSRLSDRSKTVHSMSICLFKSSPPPVKDQVDPSQKTFPSLFLITDPWSLRIALVLDNTYIFSGKVCSDCIRVFFTNSINFISLIWMKSLLKNKSF